jgi:hypothetical protein
MRLALVFTTTVAAACTQAPPLVPHSQPEERVIALRVQVAEIARPECGSCHTRSLETAKAEALAVFDFEEAAWSSRMSAEQLSGFNGRLFGNLDPTTAPVVRELLEAELAVR